MRFLRSGAIYAVANIASAAAPFLLLPLLTRVLTPAEYGEVVGFALLVTLCQTVAGLNAHAALGVVWFKRPSEELAAFTGSAIAIALASTLVVALAVGALLTLLPIGGLSPLWGLLAALTAGANVVLQCRLVLWQNQHKALASAVLQFGTSALNLGLSLLAVLVFNGGGAGRNLGIAGATMLMATVAVGLFLHAGELRWAPSREQMGTLARFGLPLIAHTLAGVLLSTTDRWSVSIRLDAEGLGIYGAGAQLGMVMTIFADAFVKAYSPWLYNRLSAATAADQRVAVGAVYAAIPGFVIVALLVGGPLIMASTLLLGPKYQAAAAVLPWFMLGGACTGIYMSTSVLFFFEARTGRLAMVTMSSALIGAASTWLLVGALGVRGAAIGYAFTQAVLALITTSMAMRTFQLPWRHPAQALGAWWQASFARASRQPG